MVRRLLVLLLLLGLSHPLVSRAFAVSPAIQELSGKRGETLQAHLEVRNTEPIPRTFYLSTLKFVSGGEGGSPVFIPYEQDHTGLPEWVVFSSPSLELAPQETGSATVSVVIPPDAPSGGYHAALVVSTAPSPLLATNGAAINANIASLLFVTVEGETSERAAILDFIAPPDRFMSHPPWEFQYRIQNQGNVHIQPVGTLRMVDLLGRTVLSMDANPAQARVLPDTTRMFQVQVPAPASGSFLDAVRWQASHLSFGPQRFVLDLSYGQDHRSLRAEAARWYLPWQLLSCLAAGFIVLVGLYRLVRRRS